MVQGPDSHLGGGEEVRGTGRTVCLGLQAGWRKASQGQCGPSPSVEPHSQNSVRAEAEHTGPTTTALGPVDF